RRMRKAGPTLITVGRVTTAFIKIALSDLICFRKPSADQSKKSGTQFGCRFHVVSVKVED
ncbi:MAG: hypothetical protein KKC72_09460, partial [Alphaproteobacteria bacterium]|nr:hypothetical protein [Alphaproteobacteria bacterium]